MLSPYERPELTEADLAWARGIAVRMCQRRGIVADDEVIQCAQVGLWTALTRWRGGVPLRAFAAPRVRGAVLQEWQTRFGRTSRPNSVILRSRSYDRDWINDHKYEHGRLVDFIEGPDEDPAKIVENDDHVLSLARRFLSRCNGLEAEIVGLLIVGMRQKQISEQLGMNFKTVRSTVSRLRLRFRAQAAR